MQITESNLETVLEYVTFGERICKLNPGGFVYKILTPRGMLSDSCLQVTSGVFGVRALFPSSENTMLSLLLQLSLGNYFGLPSFAPTGTSSSCSRYIYHWDAHSFPLALSFLEAELISTLLRNRLRQKIPEEEQSEGRIGEEGEKVCLVWIKLNLQ